MYPSIQEVWAILISQIGGGNKARHHMTTTTFCFHEKKIIHKELMATINSMIPIYIHKNN